MAQTYSYSISTDIPGGVFTSSASERLHALIIANIATSLEEISTSGNNLDVRFSAALSTGEKTILDNDTIGPAGGLVGRSADYIELVANSLVLADLDIVTLDADGIVSVPITGQLKRGDDVSINGFGESFTIKSSGIAPFNKSSGVLTDSGAFDYVAGPSFNRGSVIFTINVENLPTREIEVLFV